MSSLDIIPREDSERRLAAILVADVVGYSRLMQADEEGTLSRLEEIAASIIEPKVGAHRGHIFRTMGDGLLIEFPSVVEAVLCAAEIQDELRLRGEVLEPEQRIQLRIGINIGDVIRKGNDVFGTGVNIAARLEALAEPGSIYISGEAYDQVRDRPFAFDDLGMKAVKNIARLVRVYRVRAGEVARASTPAMAGPAPFWRRGAVVAGSVIGVVILVAVLVLMLPILRKTTTSGSFSSPTTERPIGSDEMSAWAKIKLSDKIDELASYLDRFPNSRYSEYVRHRLNSLRSHPEITKFRDCSDCPEMVVVPAGSFTMGISQTDIDRYGFSLGDSAPLHSVRIARPFALGEFLVTREQYAKFAEETGHRVSGCNALPLDGTAWKFDPALSWRDAGFAQADNHPVVCVSWDDAVGYARWLSKKTKRSYRLSTEAEWEYAARAGSAAGRYFGDAPICEFANVRDQSKKQLYSTGQFSECNGGFPNTSPVGSFPPNGFGLYDMLGNAWEWVEDCWDKSYVDAPVDGSARDKANCEVRVRRGGSWNSDHRSLYNAGSRGASRAYERSEIWGFRVASEYSAPSSAPPESLTMAQAAPSAPEAQRAPAIPTLSPPSSSGYAAEAQDFGVPPQNSIREGPPHAPTPLTVPGAKTITTADLYAQLMTKQPMLLLYVNENSLGIAGAHWLDGAGRGYSFDDPIEERLGRKVDQLTSGNKDTPVVVFCLDAHCWLSYNTTLRIVRLGYHNVLWYRGGREAWNAAGLPLVNLAREPW